jgi:glutaredoxin
LECGIWSAPAEGSGDGALDFQSAKIVRPKRCRATLATALQIRSASQPLFQAGKLLSPTEVIELALVVYTKPGCPYCQQARDYYNSKGVTFIDHDAQTHRELRAEMLKFSGGDPTVPCIVKDGKYVQSGWGDPLRG